MFLHALIWLGKTVENFEAQNDLHHHATVILAVILYSFSAWWMQVWFWPLFFVTTILLLDAVNFLGVHSVLFLWNFRSDYIGESNHRTIKTNKWMNLSWPSNNQSVKKVTSTAQDKTLVRYSILTKQKTWKSSGMAKGGSINGQSTAFSNVTSIVAFSSSSSII